MIPQTMPESDNFAKSYLQNHEHTITIAKQKICTFYAISKKISSLLSVDQLKLIIFPNDSLNRAEQSPAGIVICKADVYGTVTIGSTATSV